MNFIASTSLVYQSKKVTGVSSEPKTILTFFAVDSMNTFDGNLAFNTAFGEVIECLMWVGVCVRRIEVIHDDIRG